jgi:hypothetical protein
MLSGKLPPSAGPPPEPAAREAARDTARKRAADGGSDDVLSVRSIHSVTHHGAPRRAIAAHGQHHGHRGASQTERVIATVARNIVVSGDDGDATVTQEVDQVFFVLAQADVLVGDDELDTSVADESAAQDEAARSDEALAGDADQAGSPAAERSEAHGAEAEHDPFALDDVKSTRGRDGPGAIGMDASGGGGGWGSGGASGSGAVQAGEGVEAAAAATSIRAAGSEKATLARVRRVAPLGKAQRAQARHEHAIVRIAGIGLAAAVVVLVLVLLVSLFAPPPPSAHGDENPESRQDR